MGFAEKSLHSVDAANPAKGLTRAQVGAIRGRASVRAAYPEDVDELLAHIDALESLLDECDQDDAAGTDGWRHRLGIDE